LLGPVHWLAIIGHLIVFFLVCLISHGTLYELRPPAARLTNFYLAAALGGWIGGALVSLGAPFLFPALYEYPVIVLLLAPAFWWCREKPLTRLRTGISYAAVVGRSVVVAFLVLLIVKEGWQTLQEPVRFRHRNFYGTYTIWDVASYPQDIRQLLHGRTIHGAQLLDPETRMTPIMYYFIGGGIADVYETAPPGRRMAVLGLGAGAAASYVKPGETMVYYEIDPDNEGIARHWFSFLDECRGRVRVVVGDGRLGLQNSDRLEPPYDIIHMDAFTGDGIPTHLLTREAVRVYLERLSGNGVILFHVSNRYYELRPVIKAIAAELGLAGAVNVPTPKTELKANQSATWCVVLARNPDRLAALVRKGWIPFGPGDGLREVTPWTDDYINILLPLRDGMRERWDGFNFAQWLKTLRP
ncbi:MAG TPA: fused MFS/spermidine synthase, partial [Syntrophales bacterium]|nr:fused MFS/spermidine synthase [Syntrophales bacterium]